MATSPQDIAVSPMVWRVWLDNEYDYKWEGQRCVTRTSGVGSISVKEGVSTSRTSSLLEPA